jgi:serine/threonine-protein kinase
LLFGNRYQVEETLGQGGAGVVYRAFDLELQRPVAVKTLETARGGLDQGVERLRREAALLSRLTHPNIVGFYDLAEEAGQPYLVLEYVAGYTLRDLLEAYQAPLPLELANHIISSVLAAVKAAHQEGIIHRDLKPENIMLAGIDPEIDLDLATLQPQVKVMDFGLAYLSGETRITGENLVAGTALYMAPEAALGQAVDGRGTCTPRPSRPAGTMPLYHRPWPRSSSSSWPKTRPTVIRQPKRFWPSWKRCRAAAGRIAL